MHRARHVGRSVELLSPLGAHHPSSDSTWSLTWKDSLNPLEFLMEWVGCMKRVSQKLMLLYVEQILNGNLLSDSRNSKRASVTFQRGGMGREVQEGRIICIPMADSCSVWQKSAQFCKAFILQLKKKTFLFSERYMQKKKNNNLVCEETEFQTK